MELTVLFFIVCCGGEIEGSLRGEGPGMHIHMRENTPRPCCLSALNFILFFSHPLFFLHYYLFWLCKIYMAGTGLRSNWWEVHVE